MAVPLNLHELVNCHTPGVRDAAHIVPSEVDEHDVLAQLLLVGQKFALKGRVLRCCRAALSCPSEGPVGNDAAAIDAAEDLWRRGYEDAPARLHSWQA